MALFFDWMFFKPNDCIMNVEPAILAITNNLSLRSQPFAISLVDFLIKAADTFCPLPSGRIATSVRAGLDDMLRLGVIRSINSLLDVLLRASPDTYRSFNSLIGPLVDSTVLSVCAGVTSAPVTSNTTQAMVLSHTTNVTSTDTTALKSVIPTRDDVHGENKSHRPSTPPISTTTTLGKLKRDDVFTLSTSNLTSSTNSPSDPRLRRNTTSTVIKTLNVINSNLKHASLSTVKENVCQSEDTIRNKANPTEIQTISLSSGQLQQVTKSNLLIQTQPYLDLGDSKRNSPSILPTLSPTLENTEKELDPASSVLLSAEDIKELMTPGTSTALIKTNTIVNNSIKSSTNRVVVKRKSNSPLLSSQTSSSSLTPNFETISSPEYRNSNSTESVQQKIDNLRHQFQSYQLRYQYNVDTHVDVRFLIDQLDDPIRGALENLLETAKNVGLFEYTEDEMSNTIKSPKHQESQDLGLAEMSEGMEMLVQSVLADECFDDLEIAGRTAAVVCQLCLPLFDTSSPPTDRLGFSPSYGRRSNQAVFRDPLPSQFPITEEQICDNLASPVFVPLRHLCEMGHSDPKRELLLLLLTEMQARQPRVGYHLLYFLTVSKVNDEKMTAYRNFCASQENPNLIKSIHRDIQLLADDNRFLFCYLLPTVYSVFANDLANDTEFIRLIVGKIDPSQANYLVCEILRGHLNFFYRTNITEILKASLEWMSMEQFFFWQLVNAHELPTRNFLPLISLVDGHKHPEACSHLLLLLQLEKPTHELVRLLLSRAVPTGMSNADDLLSVTALHYWGCPGRQHAQRFATILSNMVNVAVSGLKSSGQSNDADTGEGTTLSNKEKKKNGIKNNSTSEHLPQLVSILSHLDCMRRKCKNIARKKAGICRVLEATELQSSLQQLINSNSVPVGIKDRFAELLTLVEDDSPDGAAHISSNFGFSKSLTIEMRESTGSKGGHSLRNLDSRRAAEAERRRNQSHSCRKSKNSSNNSSSDNEDAISNDSNEERQLTVRIEDDATRANNLNTQSDPSSLSEDDEESRLPSKRQNNSTQNENVISSSGRHKRRCLSHNFASKTTPTLHSVHHETGSKRTIRVGKMNQQLPSDDEEVDDKDNSTDNDCSESEIQISRILRRKQPPGRKLDSSKIQSTFGSEEEDGEITANYEVKEQNEKNKKQLTHKTPHTLPSLSVVGKDAEENEEENYSDAPFRPLKRRKATTRRYLVDD